MAKKVQDLNKLEIEIQLQKSKLQSLLLMSKEIQGKIERLQSQLDSIKTKGQKLKSTIAANEAKLQSYRNLK